MVNCALVLFCCHRKEGINNCPIFVFNTPNIKLIILFVFIQGSSDQTAVEEASATTYPPFGGLSLHRFVNQNNSVLPAYHTGIFLSFSDFRSTLLHYEEIKRAFLSCNSNGGLPEILLMLILLNMGMSSDFLYGEKGR